MVKAVPRALDPASGPDGHRIRLIVIGTIPIVIVGLTLADVIESSLAHAAGGGDRAARRGGLLC